MPLYLKERLTGVSVVGYSDAPILPEEAAISIQTNKTIARRRFGEIASIYFPVVI
jgi:hypothetical protein